MTTLAVDTPRVFDLGNVNEYPVIAADIIYEGAAVGDNATGYVRPLVAGDSFRGFAESNVDNSLGSAGDKRVRVLTQGKVQLSVASLTITDVGKPVYASDDNTFTLTRSTNSYIGRVHRFVSSGVGVIAFDANKGELGLIGELLDSTGGTPSGTLALVAAGTPADLVAQGVINGVLANALASLAAKVNLVARQLG